MLKKNNKPYTLLPAVLRNCVLFLSVFFFSSASSSAFAEIITSNNVSSIDAVHILPGDFFISSDHHLPNPYQSDSAPEEPEESAETEHESNDNDSRLLFWIHSSEYAFSITASVRNHFYRLTRAYQNQATLPLYVLFHSWKSYLL